MSVCIVIKRKLLSYDNENDATDDFRRFQELVQTDKLQALEFLQSGFSHLIGSNNIEQEEQVKEKFSCKIRKIFALCTILFFDLASINGFSFVLRKTIDI